MDIKPIETIYNGYKFRSRLEARWAVFFDTLGIKYEYEPEGFDIETDKGVVRYLPDFRIAYSGRGSDRSGQIYIEVKGDKVTKRDAIKIEEFSVHHPILVVGNIPESNWEEDIRSRCYENFSKNREHQIYEFNFKTLDGDYFGAYPVANLQGKFEIVGDTSNCFRNVDYEKTAKAYNIARQARFEFNQK